MLLLFIVPVSAAGNYHDTLYEYSYSQAAPGSHDTELRGKWDYTSSYGYNMNSNVNITEVHVQGAYEIWYGGYDCTYGTPKNLPIGAAYYFPNTVKEEGNQYAGLQFWTELKAPTYVYMWWSPDSI